MKIERYGTKQENQIEARPLKCGSGARPRPAAFKLGGLGLLIATIFGFFSAPVSVYAAGTLTPANSSDLPIQIRSHHLEVTINNGFAQTEVTQTFFNPNEHSLEGLYTAHDLKYRMNCELRGERYIAEPEGGARDIYTERKK